MTRIGCRDLDPNWPGLDGKPRGPVLCVSYPRCSCGEEDARHEDDYARAGARVEDICNECGNICGAGGEVDGVTIGCQLIRPMAED